jgi:hypothetical protein
MPFCDSVSIIIYLSGAAEGITRFLPINILGTPLNNNFPRDYLLKQPWHLPSDLSIELKLALQRRFSCVFESSTAASFHDQFVNPLEHLIPIIDDVADEDSYQICLFRPDIFHLGARVKGRAESRFVLFSSIKAQSEIQVKNFDYDIQYHPLALFMAMQLKKSPIINFFDPSVSVESKKRTKAICLDDVKSMFRDFIDENVVIVDVLYDEKKKIWERVKPISKEVKKKKRKR